jgi:glycosyltransferase involved in cell wall biosynthesis
MNICMFALDQCNEHKIAVRKVAKTLAEAGHDVRVIAILSDETAPYEESEGFRIFRVALDPLYAKIMRLVSLPARFGAKLSGLLRRESNPSSVGASLGGATDDEGAHAGGRVSVFYPLVLGYRLLYRIARWLVMKLPAVYLRYLNYYYCSFQMARREPAAVYHAHDLVTLPVAWLCSRLAKGKLVYDSRELWLDRPEKQRSRFNTFLVRRIESFLIRCTDANIIFGESAGKVLTDRYNIVTPAVILNVPPYYPFHHSTVFRDKLRIPTGERIVLYMGRISYGRGVEQAIQSIRYSSNCSLVVFGFGPDQYISSLKELIENEGVTDRVYFFDAVPFDEVTRYAMSADVGLVLHKNVCLNYYYVSPNKLFECMAAGLPVVGSNFPDLKMFIEGYNLGVTCDPDNPKEIADAIDYILSDEDRYNEMRKNALEAAKIFNWENESKKLLALYEGLND